MLNGDELLEKHLSKGPSNAQNTSRLSARVLIERLIFGSKESLCAAYKRVPIFQTLQMSATTSVLNKSAIHLWQMFS